MVFVVMVLILIILAQWATLYACKQTIRQALKMLDALSAIHKLKPNMLDDPAGYPKKCQQAVKDMAKIAKDCILEISKENKGGK